METRADAIRCIKDARSVLSILCDTVPIQSLGDDFVEALNKDLTELLGKVRGCSDFVVNEGHGETFPMEVFVEVDRLATDLAHRIEQRGDWGNKVQCSTKALTIAALSRDGLEYCKGKGKPQEGTQQSRARVMPDKVMTDRAKKYFGRALEEGLMEGTTIGYKWQLNNASLAYFLKQIYNPDNVQAIPYKALENLFGVTKLAKTLDQALIASKPQKWRERIDQLFAD